ncbi:MAG: cold shock domain-containing protein [bacterium]
MRGVVKWFDSKKGYGFITAEQKDYFVHFTAIQGEGFKTLREGEEVEFEFEQTPKGLSATKVFPIRTQE